MNLCSRVSPACRMSTVAEVWLPNVSSCARTFSIVPSISAADLWSRWCGEPVVDARPVGRIAAGRGIVVHRVIPGNVREAIGGPDRKEMRLRRLDLRRQLLQRREVIENPDTATVRRDHEIVEMLLDR